MTGEQSKILFLCRTPLQARVCLQIIKEERIEKFDIVYFTQNNSDSDLSYFSKLKAMAGNACYLYIPQRKPDLINHLVAIWRLRKEANLLNYKKIYLASIDSLVFRYAIKKNQHATLYGFDDGTANITPCDSNYYNIGRYKRANLYGWLLGLPTPRQVICRLERHFSIYPGFKNIITESKVTFISIFNRTNPDALHKNDIYISFFIGQPFHEYLKAPHVTAIRNWLMSQAVDFYVMHPREKIPLLENIPVLDKEGLLAEDVIFKAAKGCRPRIISAYSTVLFNISHQDAEKVYLSVGNDDVERQRLALIRKTGSMVVNIN